MGLKLLHEVLPLAQGLVNISSGIALRIAKNIIGPGEIDREFIREQLFEIVAITKKLIRLVDKE